MFHYIMLILGLVSLPLLTRAKLCRYLSTNHSWANALSYSFWVIHCLDFLNLRLIHDSWRHYSHRIVQYFRSKIKTKHTFLPLLQELSDLQMLLVPASPKMQQVILVLRLSFPTSVSRYEHLGESWSQEVLVFFLSSVSF